MSEKLLAYYETLRASFIARSRGDVAREDDLLADLDKLWLSMIPLERQCTSQVAKLALFVQEQDALGPAVQAQLEAVVKATLTGSSRDTATRHTLLVQHRGPVSGPVQRIATQQRSSFKATMSAAFSGDLQGERCFA